jgi:hypothetical protein
VITPHARDRYNALIGIYGARFSPAIKPDYAITATGTNTFLLSPEGVGKFRRMNGWSKQGAGLN